MSGESPQVFDFPNPLAERRDYSLRDAEAWRSAFGLPKRNALAAPAVWRSVTLIADTVAILPLRVMQMAAGGVGQRRPSNPAQAVIDQPNTLQNPFTFRRSLALSLAGWGNAFAIIGRRDGRPVDMMYVPPHAVSVRDMGNQLMYVVHAQNRETLTLPSANVLHVVGQSLDGKIGISPIQFFRHVIERDDAMTQFGAEFYERGPRVAGWLQTESHLDEEEANTLEDRFRKKYMRGGAKEGSVAVLTKGLTFKNAPLINPNDAKYLDSKKLSAVEIAMIFGVPPPMLGILDDATLNNVESLTRQFAMSTIVPHTSAIEAELGRKLIRNRDQRGEAKLYFAHDLTELLKGSPKDQAEANRIRINGGWVTRNEARASENRPPLDDLDKPLVPGNMNVVGEEPAPAPNAAPAGDPQLDADTNPDQRFRWSVVSNRRVA